MLGLMPTQREEWQRKHRIRYFLETMALDMRDIANGTFGAVARGLSAIGSFVMLVVTVLIRTIKEDL